MNLPYRIIFEDDDSAFLLLIAQPMFLVDSEVEGHMASQLSASDCTGSKKLAILGKRTLKIGRLCAAPECKSSFVVRRAHLSSWVSGLAKSRDDAPTLPPITPLLFLRTRQLFSYCLL